MVIYCATRKPPQETALHSLTQPHTASHSLTQPHLLKPLGQDADAAIGHRLQQWKDSHHLQSIPIKFQADKLMLGSVAKQLATPQLDAISSTAPHCFIRARQPAGRQAAHRALPHASGPTSSAGLASGSMRTNHCSRTSGSTTSPPRWLRGTRSVWGSSFSTSPWACMCRGRAS